MESKVHTEIAETNEILNVQLENAIKNYGVSPRESIIQIYKLMKMGAIPRRNLTCNQLEIMFHTKHLLGLFLQRANSVSLKNLLIIMLEMAKADVPIEAFCDMILKHPNKLENDLTDDFKLKIIAALKGKSGLEYIMLLLEDSLLLLPKALKNK